MMANQVCHPPWFPLFLESVELLTHDQMLSCCPDDSQISFQNVASLLKMHHYNLKQATLNHKPDLALWPWLELEDCSQPEKMLLLSLHYKFKFIQA